ncbi:MAG: hypothetical protein MPJ24_09000 [Pirellulaceae bacterium]|nr:hypothetical protein [Pirellulaceae bacterium]
MLALVSPQLRLYSLEASSLKDLSGFNKNPKGFFGKGGLTETMLYQLGEKELSDELETIFQQLKTAFNFRRKELLREGPIEGGGTLTTPYFQYHINLQKIEDYPDMVGVLRQVEGLANLDLLTQKPFINVFQGKLNTLELRTSRTIQVESWIDHLEEKESLVGQLFYPSDCRFVQLTLEKGALEITFLPEKIELKIGASGSLASLPAAYSQIKETLIGMV